MKKIVALGLAVLMLVSVAALLPVMVGAEVIPSVTFEYDFSAYCDAEDYGFVSLRDVTVEGGTDGYYTFTAQEDGVSAGLDPIVYLPAPTVELAEMAVAVVLYRTDTDMRGEFFVDRTDDVIMGQFGSHAYWQYIGDDEWHLAIVDASAIWGDAAEGVAARHFRFDPLALCEEGDSVDVSYIKFFVTDVEAEAYVAANSECVGEISKTEQVVEWNGKVYGYTEKVAVEYADKTLRAETLDYDLGLTTDTFNLNESFLLRDVENRDEVFKDGRVIAWRAGGYEGANHPLLALYGQDNNYALYDSLPFAEYDRVTIILCSSGEVVDPWVVGFVSDKEQLLGTDIENVNETAAIVYGECVSPQSEEGVFVNLSGLGTGISWNSVERAVTMNIEGCTWDGPAALYVGSHGGHIAVVVKMVFERDVEAGLYVDGDGNEYIDGEDPIYEEEGVYYAYTGLFEVTAVENEGVVEYWYDPRVYFAVAPEAPQPPTHTITFIADGKVVATYTFTEGSTVVDWTAPEVPAKDGFIGSWHAYVLGGNADLEVRARYTLAPSTDESTTGEEESTTVEQPSNTESDTELVTESDTTVTDTDTEIETDSIDPTATVTDTKNDETSDESAGCKSVIASASILAVVAMAAGVVVCRKKD